MAPPRNRHGQGKSRKDLPRREIPNVVQQQQEIKDVIETSSQRLRKPWTPSSYTAFKALLSARLCAAVWSNISDCDETFNYWEPTHYLLYGTGFQTWEYSPVYAIRSYAYLWLHALPGRFYSTLLQSNKILVFYFIRCLLGFCCALCEVYFYRGICHHFGAHVGRLTLMFLVLGAGMFISSAAFLPSSFSMYMIMLALGGWFLQRYEVAIFGIAVSSLVGWPFTAILGLPIAYDILFERRKIFFFLKWSLLALVLILGPVMMIDTHYYGHLIVAPVNIVLYNVFTDHGANLYGTEPWTFYFINGFLNFNFLFFAALFSIPALMLLWFLVQPSRRKNISPSFVLCLSPIYLWLIVFIFQMHKEERFLFPLYPLFCLAGSVTTDVVQKVFFHVFVRRKVNHYLESTNWIAVVFCVACSVLSVSRAIAVYKGYHAPMETYMELSRVAQDPDVHPLPNEVPINVCTGKEWYRFPSSFFLPENWHLQFLRSEFQGQLPKPYSKFPNATKIIPEHMNDQNLEEASRYADIKNCHYLIDSDYPSESPWEPRYSQNTEDWKIISTVSFLETKSSPRLLRAFYIPFLTEFKCSYIDYNLLQSTKVHEKQPAKKKKKMIVR